MRCSASSGEIARRLGVDLHLDVGDVGHGIDRQALIVVDAERGQQRHDAKHEPALVQRELDDSVQHGAAPQ